MLDNKIGCNPAITKYCDLRTSSSSKLDLRINSVQLEDENVYACENQRGEGYDINLTVTGTLNSCSLKNPSKD